MKQVLQYLKTGNTQIAQIPIPRVSSGSLLIQTNNTLVSAGTERMIVEFGKAGWLEKARQQPDKVRMVLDKIKTDGLQPTIEAVLNKLDQPLPLGYCNVGKVFDFGRNVSNFNVGDRVVSNGNHAEVVSVPSNLCAKIPDEVSDEEAAFTVLGAIALQGIRLVKPTLGEAVVVTGLGLIGLMTVQLLRANGCRVLGIDLDPKKLAIAKQFGADIVDISNGQDPIKTAELFSRGRGVDAVIVAAATKSNEPIHQAALMCRKRGRIVLVGVTGLDLSRDDFFKKELTFQVSASYGPGRYDPNYEERGQDYPVGFVRWTEQRNFEAVLDMMACGALDVKQLVSHRFEIDDAENAYKLIAGMGSSLGILLQYPGFKISETSKTLKLDELDRHANPIDGNNQAKTTRLSFLGSGNYATSVLIPAFKRTGAVFEKVASYGGVSAFHAAKKYGFSETTTDSDSLFTDKNTDAVIITTRHNSHANYVLKGLDEGKHIFVEKPLCLTLEELSKIEKAYKGTSHLMVGFNRRFAPHIQRMKSLMAGVTGPKSMVMIVNAGTITTDHWTQDIEIGGGRIIGEACHFIDLLRFLAGVTIVSYRKTKMNAATQDTVTLELGFEDGSIGTVHYFANGSKSFPKERLEIFASGRVLQLDNFRKLKGYGWPRFNKMNLWRQDKGQDACAQAFINALLKNDKAPIPIEEILEVSRISIELANA